MREETRPLHDVSGVRLVGGKRGRLEIHAPLHGRVCEAVLLRLAGHPLADQFHPQIPAGRRFPALDGCQHVRGRGAGEHTRASLKPFRGALLHVDHSEGFHAATFAALAFKSPHEPALHFCV
jgi:hypothetical protein